MTNCPLCEAVFGHFLGPISRYVKTFIDYQGAVAFLALDLMLWMVGGHHLEAEDTKAAA